jgi:D-alanine-D-alanine ligase
MRTLHTCIHKARTKSILMHHGLPTAAFQVFASATEQSRVRFPAFVKPVAEDASIGVSERAVVHNETELLDQVRYILKEMGEPALVEEFIAGREFNVAIWGNDPPQALPLAEIDYQHIADPYRQIISFAAKWDKSAYRILGCRDYGRVDIRVRGDQPYILEVNPNCGIAPDAGFPREARAAGYDYAAMCEQIVLFASARRGKRSQA